MNLIGEQVNHESLGIGTIKLLNKASLLTPAIHVEFNDENNPLIFEYENFSQGYITAVREDVQQYILATANKTKEYLNKVNTKRKRSLQKAEEKYMHGQLRPDETLMHFEMNRYAIPIGIFSFIFGAYFILDGVHYFTQSDGSLLLALFLSAIGVLLLWCGFCKLTKIRKNHYFVTNKRLGIREAFVFKQEKNIDIAINEIESVSYNRSGAGRYNHETYLIINTKDGTAVELNTPYLALMEYAIRNEVRRCSK